MAVTVNVVYRRQARWYTPGRIKPVRLIVLHDPEAPQADRFPQSLGDYFATTDRKASAHAGAGPSGVGRYVDDGDTAFGAAKANADGLHLEIAGYAAYTRMQWLSSGTGMPTLHNAADQVAEWCRLHAIPASLLVASQIADGHTRGITTHRTISDVWPSTGHTDPGPEFPLDVLVNLVRGRLLGTPEEDDMTPAQEAKLDELLALAKKHAADETTRHDLLLNRSGHGELPDVLAAVETITSGGADAAAIVDEIGRRLAP